MQELARVVRGRLVESIHHGMVAVTRRGRVILARGDIDRPVYLRSTAKPLQAWTALECGAALTARELGVACGSHLGDARAVAPVRSILRKIGLSEQDLKCGAHWPESWRARIGLARPGSIHNNCSGNHAGMLAACRARGWPTGSYLDSDHPLQRANLQTIRLWSGARRVEIGIDGCGAPAYAIALRRLALAFERLLGASPRIFEAMVGHPEYLGEDSGRLTRAGLGEIVFKGGGDGVMAAAIPAQSVGIAIKCLDGSFRPHAAVVAALCERLRLLSPGARRSMCRAAELTLRNHRGRITGRLVPRIS
jgi:L-asparaginase II